MTGFDDWTERRETYQSLRAVFGLSQRRGLESGSDWLRFSRLRNSQQETIDKWENDPAGWAAAFVFQTIETAVLVELLEESM
jgi:hypothetical protein